MDYETKAYRADSPNAGQMQQKVTPENPLYELMRGYVQAKEAFDDACHSYNRAAQVKAAAEKMLLEISEKVNHTVQQGVYDPTSPQCPAPNQLVGNGLAQGYGPARY